MSGPRVTSGSASKQDYSTPLEFIHAVEQRFGTLTVDLAAHRRNTKCARWFGPGGERENSLAAPWPRRGLCWLNPPFADIAPWARKCTQEAAQGAEVLLLVPASVGSNWFRQDVAPCANTYLLNGRLSFDGKNVFPKDCLLAHFHDDVEPAIQIWDWRKDELSTPWSGRRT